MCNAESVYTLLLLNGLNNDKEVNRAKVPPSRTFNLLKLGGRTFCSFSRLSLVETVNCTFQKHQKYKNKCHPQDFACIAAVLCRRQLVMTHENDEAA